MPRRKFEKNSIRKLIKLGNGSLAVTLPIELARALKWKEKQKVTVKKIRGGFSVRDWKR